MAWQSDSDAALDAIIANVKTVRGLVDATVTLPGGTTTPPPGGTTPTTGAGGTTVGGSFTGRSTNVDSKWVKAFEDDFPTLAPEGKFLSTYSKWGAYPTNYLVTDKQGFYDPGKISVIDTDGTRAMQCRLVPASRSSDGKRPSGCAPQPKFGPQGDGRTKGEKIEMRVRVDKAASGYHVANLGWPLSDSDWPRLGEDDFLEFNPSSGAKVGAYLHVQNGGSSGQGQQSFSSGVSAESWFVIGRERVAGQSYKWFVNGQQVGNTITSAVPNDYFRWVLQNETSGTNQSGDCLIQYDWVTWWTLA